MKLEVLFWLFCGLMGSSSSISIKERALLQEEEIEPVRNNGFVVLEERTVNDFEDAIETCRRENLVVGVVDSLDKFVEVSEVATESELNFYIGLKRKTVPESFDFVDNFDNQDKSYFSESFVQPWAALFPINAITDDVGINSCVFWKSDGWEDDSCEDINSVLCSTDCEDDGDILLRTTSDCINNNFKVTIIPVQPLVSPGAVNDIDLVSEATKLCGSLGNTGRVVRIENDVEFNEVNDFLFSSSSVQFLNLFIGLQRKANFNTLNPLLYSFNQEKEDENENKTFFQKRGLFPWSEGQPNNNNLGDQACVEWRVISNLWSDIPCNRGNLNVLCQSSDLLTNNPTISPVSLPSISPTNSPTMFPSILSTETDNVSVEEEIRKFNNIFIILSVGFLFIFIIFSIFLIKEILKIKNKQKEIKNLNKIFLKSHDEDNLSESI